MTLTIAHHMQGVGSVHRISVPYEKATVAEIADQIYAGAEGVSAWLRAPAGHAVEWIEIPRQMWSWIRPKVGDAVKFTFRPGKSILRTIFSVIVAVVVAVVAPYLTAALGAIGGSIASAALGVGLSLLGNALFPVSQASQAAASGNVDSDKQRAFSNVETDSNLLAKEAYLPVVAGARRISPPELTYPLLRLENGIQTVSRVFALDGRHAISAIQVDETPVGDFPSITTEIKDGAEATSVATTLLTKVNNTVNVSETLSTFSADEVTIVDQAKPSNSEPRWVRFTTVADPKMEEIILRLQLSSFIKSDSADAKVRVPMRIRFRPKGSTGAWFNLPEIHIVGRDISTSLREIRLRWDNQFGGEDATGGDLSYEFFQRVPAVTAFTLSNGATGDQWQADDWFVADTGLSAVANVSGRRNGVRVVLNEDDFPKQAYEWEVIRGASCTAGDLTSSYTLGGSVNSLFVSRYSTAATWQIPVDQGAYTATVALALATTVVDRQPCQRPETAIIGLKATGQSVKNVTVIASRYVKDWDGTGWNVETTTNNPATHYRQILHDWLSYNGVDTSLIASGDFVAWRQECIDRGYEVSALMAGESVLDNLARIATAGFARPRYSDGFGVDFFRDRSEERPVQSFSPRNATISIDWAMSTKPAGVRAKFQNETDGYKDDEVQISNPVYTNSPRYNVVEYDSIANPDLVYRRAYFDMLQMHYQGRRAITVDTAIEGLVCERGDLVAVVTDLLNDNNSGTRIRSVIDSTNFTIDQRIPTEATESIFGADDVFAIDDIFTTGEQTVCLISTPTGTEMRTIVAAEGDVIRVSEALPSVDLVGAHIVLGPISKFTNRCIVSEIRRQSEERAKLVLLDEAPEIYQKMQERFG